MDRMNENKKVPSSVTYYAQYMYLYIMHQNTSFTTLRRITIFNCAKIGDDFNSYMLLCKTLQNK